MERLKERLAVAERAMKTLEELAALPASARTAIQRDAMIQRFEYTQEAVWKTAQRFLLVIEGVDRESPKSVVRASAEVELLTKEQAREALAMVDDRNLSVHTYNEELAVALSSRIPGHAALLRNWLSAMQTRLTPED